MRVASLGMYDGGALVSANDALWRHVGASLRDDGIDEVPDALDRARPLPAIWDDPALLLAQTCGYPLSTRWRGRLRVVATPRYAASGCEGAAHRSLIVVRADDPAAGLADLRGRIAAINDRASNTGVNLLRAAVAPLAGRGRFFDRVIETGSHAASAKAVAAGEADVAAIDAVTFAHLERHAAEVTRALRVVALSPLAPGLPLVTADGTGDDMVAALRAALARAAADPALGWARALLLIDGFEIPRDDAYDRVLLIEAEAARVGYPALA